ncbi:uncharacterized protein LOC116264005 [Nymphaea colorata]|nr:uncharacterized protein LOC116264005 [Nymphaea colorata]
MLEEKVAWSCETNWSVSQGDLRKTILLETSTSLPSKADEERAAVEPLLLKPSPSVELGPCEITVKFSQEHEIHRVYLRSTARVYEIFYATEQHDGNEYLCTTRCGPVKRKCHPFQADCSLISASSEGTKNDHTEEDGWIDVKVPGFVLPDEAYPSLKISEVGKQEEDCCFYEGTAEICGANPCIYLTIRLLSLYTKGSVCLGQLYILASPTASSVFCEPSNPAVSSGNASLLAMLVPSLIQLYREGSEAQGRPSSGSMKPCNGSEMETERAIQMKKKPVEDTGKVEQLHHSSGAAKAYISGNTREEGYSDRVKDESYGSGATICTGMNRREESESVRSSGEGCGSTSCSCQCEALVKLNEKVDRIAAYCASIEENMIKPLVSMETRLKQLEEKLDAVLTSELNKHANFSRDGSFGEEYDGIKEDGCQSRKGGLVAFDGCKCFNCNGFDDESATGDDIESDSEDTSCSSSSSDSSNDSDKDDVSEDEDVGSEDIEENENELVEQNNLVVMGGSESFELACMSCSNDGKNYSVIDNDYPEEDGQTEECASDDNDDIEEHVKDHPGSADALNTLNTMSHSTVKSKWSIEEAVVSALSDFIATTAAANGSYSERASVTNMNIIDKESWKPVITEAIFSSQSTEESQLLACGGAAYQDQLVAATLGKSNAIGSSRSTISTLKCTNELQSDGIQEDEGDPGIQYEESLRLKPEQPFALNENLEKGFQILNHIKEQNQQFKNAFKYKTNSEDFDDSFLDVKFVVDRNCQSDFALEVLLGGHDLATVTCMSNCMLNSGNEDHLLSLEEDPTSVTDSVEYSSSQIDNFPMPEELNQIGPIMEGWRETTDNGVDSVRKNIDLLCLEDVLQTDPVCQTVNPSLSAHQSSFYSVSDKQKEVHPVDAASGLSS